MAVAASRGWKPTPPDPVSVYGSTKLEGEEAIRASGCRHLIFRTSWVYARTWRQLCQDHADGLPRNANSLTVIDDQIGAPTGADLLADVTAHAIRTAMQRPDCRGLYHLVAGGETSWHGYAGFVLNLPVKPVSKSRSPRKILPVPTSAFPLPAPRPQNSRLDTSKLQTTFDVHLPLWQIGVARMLTEILVE